MADQFNTLTRPRMNTAGTTAPVSGTDNGSTGYAVGSIWINATGNAAYICTAVTTTTATWLQIG